MFKGWHFRARHILDCIAHLERLTSKHDSNSFAEDLDSYRAAERNLEIIAEASKHLPETLKAHYPALPWKQIVNMRNIISHDYSSVDEAIIWTVINDRIPKLKNVVQDMLDNYPDQMKEP